MCYGLKFTWDNYLNNQDFVVKEVAENKKSEIFLKAEIDFSCQSAGHFCSSAG